MQDSFGLPQTLPDGLVMRWATPADADELSLFNVAMHSDDPQSPEEHLGYWTRDLMNGRHPTTQASDFIVVVDPQHNGKIVSSLNLISQTWTYDGIPFGVGRPELVATDPAYRRRGLVRRQMEIIHAKSASRGELVQAITGIPWYYRQFGYEMAPNLGGGSAFFWHRPGNNKPVASETYQMRPATPADIPVLTDLYAIHCANSLLNRPRTERTWLYEMSEAHRETAGARHLFLIEMADSHELVAYVEYRHWGKALVIRELGVRPGHSWRAVSLFLTRELKRLADQIHQSTAGNKTVDYLWFHVGVGHPVHEALGRQLERPRLPYAWYIRVPDLPAFLWHIAPALEARLAGSVMAGHTGTLKFNFYQSQMLMTWERGRLADIGNYTPDRLDEGDARFPDLTFLQLLFGYRSLEELTFARVDTSVSQEETAILLNCLFPKRPSYTVFME